MDYKGFLAWMREKDLSCRTQRSYLTNLRLYGQYSGGKEPDQESVHAWKHLLLQSNNSPRTVNAKLAAVDAYCAYAGISIRIRRVKVQRCSSIGQILTADEVERLISGLEGDGNIRGAAIVRLLAKTGGRISEVVRYRVADLARGHVDMETKGKIRRIYFPRALADELAPWTDGLQDSDTLCRTVRGSPITADAVRKWLKRAAARYGLDPGKVHPHAFRHFYAVEFLRRNNNLAFLADVLGHANIETTRIYLRLTESQQQKEIDRTVDW